MQQPLSIVQVIDMLNAGGAERVLINLSNLLYAHGHKVAVLTTVKPGPLAAQLHEGIQLHNLNRGWKWNPLTMYRLIRSVQEYDIIHVHSRHNLRYLLLAKAIFGLQKKIVYQEHHGHRIHTKATALEKKIFPATVFIAVSEQLKNWAITEACVAAGNVFVLPNIILKEKAAITIQRTDILQLVMVANFVPVKNMEFAIAVMQQLLVTKANGFHLTIIGAAADQIYYETIFDLIIQKGLQQNITVIHDCTNVQQLLPQFQMALHTSASESGPLVLIEYLAQGIPFITYNTGEVAETLQKDLPDFIMPVFDVAAWCSTIEMIVQKDKELLQLQMQQLFDTYYSPDTYYKKCISIYSNADNTDTSF